LFLAVLKTSIPQASMSGLTTPLRCAAS